MKSTSQKGTDFFYFLNVVCFFFFPSMFRQHFVLPGSDLTHGDFSYIQLRILRWNTGLVRPLPPSVCLQIMTVHYCSNIHGHLFLFPTEKRQKWSRSSNLPHEALPPLYNLFHGLFIPVPFICQQDWCFFWNRASSLSSPHGTLFCLVWECLQRLLSH